MKKFLNKLLQKPKLAEPGEINAVWFDRFTFVHFFIGCAYGFLGFHFWMAMILAILWEIIENPLKFYFPAVFPRGTADTVRNAVSDIIAVITGWLIVTYLQS